jgi:hypothetical protein
VLLFRFHCPASLLRRSLLNKKRNVQWQKQASTQYAGVHVSDAAVDGGAGRLQSVTDRHELDEFLCDALLKESEFEVQHSSMVILSNEVVAQRPKADHNLFEYEVIPIPRRPLWDEDTTHEMLDRAEREAFMRWRRDLANMEESQDERTLTPFEKNLEVRTRPLSALCCVSHRCGCVGVWGLTSFPFFLVRCAVCSRCGSNCGACLSVLT